MSEQQLDAQIETSEASTQSSANKVNPPIKEVIAYLAEKFPLCFITEGEVKPLKIGLFQDLAEALAEQQAEHAAIALAQAKEAFAARKAEQRKAQRKEFFKKQREEGKSAPQHKAKKAFVKRKVADAPKATAESLAALANKFSR